MIKRIIFITGIVLCAFSTRAQTDSSSREDVFTIVEKMPEFPGGNQAMMEFIQRNVVYPPIEREYGVRGTVYVTFVVEKDGSLSNVRCLRGVKAGPGLDKEAMRVISSMPVWAPGTQNGRAVRVQYNLPIKFSIRGNDLSAAEMQKIANSYYDAGMAAAKKEHYEEALAQFDYTIFYMPDDIDTLYQRGLAFHNLKNDKSACEEWNKIKLNGSTKADEQLNKYCK